MYLCHLGELNTNWHIPIFYTKLSGAFVAKCVEQLQLNELLAFVRFVHSISFHVGLAQACYSKYVYLSSGLPVLAAIIALCVVIYCCWKRSKGELCSSLVCLVETTFQRAKATS